MLTRLLSLFSPSSAAQTLPGLHRLRTETAGLDSFRGVFLSSPFAVSPHFVWFIAFGDKEGFFVQTI